ncbi:hypothetical protein EBU94_07400 [bacterium]|nr:hypothetical protein [bacterium]
MADLIKSSNGLNQDDLNMLREKFLDEYSKKRGWDKNNLTSTQMFEIVNQKEYKNPGMLLS